MNEANEAVVVSELARLRQQNEAGQNEANEADVVSELARLRRQAVEAHSDGLYLSGLYAGLQDLARAHPDLAGIIAERARLWARALAPDVVGAGHWSAQKGPR